jgi:NAD(P)-dependent dehydrogenase (short-subunit alcohol dehydrogenase family)
MTGQFCIVTGANNGIGFSVAKNLLKQGAHVIMACRSTSRCDDAVKNLLSILPNSSHLIHPMELNLADLWSVKKFASEYSSRFDRLDVLVNNAGAIISEGTKTAQGLEASFGTMHIGHYALTKWLLKLMLKRVSVDEIENELSPARIVNVASAAYLVGNFDPSIMVGNGSGDLMGEIVDNCGHIDRFKIVECCPAFPCPNTNGYARSKLANILHIQELQKRIDSFVSASRLENNTTEQANTADNTTRNKYRRIVTASVHPGIVYTSIAPWFRAIQFFLRSIDEASYIVLHAIFTNSFVPGSYIDGVKRDADLQNYREKYLRIHLDSFPSTKTLPFAFPSILKIPNFDKHRWDKLKMIMPSEKIYDPETVAARLWDISEQIIYDFEHNNTLLSTIITDSSNNFDLRLN